jgi:hypothetical protein
MVKIGVIVRLARGLFARPASGIKFSAFQIASAKAKAFGKAIAKLEWVAQKHESTARRQEDWRFLTNGRSSSFRFEGGKIELHGICPKKFRLTESEAGQFCLALWQLGRQSFPMALVYDLAPGLARHDFFVRLKFYLPAWLGEYFKTRAYPCVAIVLSETLNPPCWLAPRSYQTNFCGNVG